MTSILKRMICQFLMLAVALVPFQSQAGMIGTDQLVSSTAAQADRTTVTNFLNRGETVSQLQSLGLDAQTATERVAAMTDAEVSTLAGKVNALPVGSDGLVALVLIVFFIWYFAFRR